MASELFAPVKSPLLPAGTELGYKRSFSSVRIKSPMNRLLVILAAVTLLSCGGDDPSISGVFPARGFLDKTMMVQISGSETNWRDGVDIDFGAGITVTDALVASPSSLVATITIAPDAPIGARDVIVGSKTLSGVFSVESPLAVTVSGTEAQGSVLVVDVQNLDFERPFDTTSTGGGLFGGPLQFPNFDVDLGEGTSVAVGDVQPYSAQLLVGVDTSATAGAHTLTVFSGPTTEFATLALPEAISIDERAPTSLALGSPAMGSQQPYGSSLYSVSLSDLQLLSAEVLVSSVDADPVLFLLSAAGSFQSVLADGTELVLPYDDDFYVVLVDLSGAAGYQFQVSVSGQAMTAATESTENNETFGAAVVLSLPFQYTASFASSVDEDWFTFTAAQGDSIHVVTAPGSPAADAKVFLYESDGSTLVAESSDATFHEDFKSPALDAGTYYIDIQWSPEFAGDYSASSKDYVASFWLE